MDMARTGIKRKILPLLVIISCFLLGGLTAYLIFGDKDEGLFISSMFKNPTGQPHIKGPDEPPPLPISGQ
ncbi:MAG: hypothetical protein WC565_01395 [Parcubacteria group bacterium]